MKKLIVGIVLACITQTTLAFTYTVKITKEELQAKVNKMMPMEKNKFFLTVVLSDPNIDLAEGNNEIGIFSHIKVIGPGGIKGTGDAKIIGTLSYDADNGKFYFKDAKIESLYIDKMPPKFIPKVKKLVQLLASKYLAKKPVYTLKDNNLKQKLAKSLLQSVKVKNQLLIVELSVF